MTDKGKSTHGQKQGDEFDLIAQYFAPLSTQEPGARNLQDDAAVLDIEPNTQIVATMDTVISGVHFLPTDPPESIAAKVIGVNLSDLASMGADPYVYTLSAALPSDIEGEWLKRFTGKLAELQAKYGITLVGGDTVVTPGPLTLTINALGKVPSGQSLSRIGARVGDTIYVSGRIGDGAMGLRVLQNKLIVEDKCERDRFVEKYQNPTPRLKLGKALRGLATSAIDISDGLLQDLGHICKVSSVGASIEITDIPLSSAIRSKEKWLGVALSGGDDYELLFTIPQEKINKFNLLKHDMNVKCSAIGQIISDAGVTVTKDGIVQQGIVRLGYNHFSSHDE